MTSLGCGSLAWSLQKLELLTGNYGSLFVASTVGMSCLASAAFIYAITWLGVVVSNNAISGLQ